MSKEKDIDRVFDENIELKDNAMLKKRPELFYEWDFEKNDELGLDVYKITFGSNKKAWWTCLDCKSNYDMLINPRINNNYNCPYCSGRRVNKTNSLASLNPELASQWHPTRNGDLTPHDVTGGSNKKVWWLGECGHEWEAIINSRTSGENNCPYCSNRRVLRGFNDMWTTNPELASILLNPEDGYRYTKMSSIPLDWKCPYCSTEIKRKYINTIDEGLNICPKCDDKRSFGERMLFSLLSHFKVEFLYDRTLKWSQGKRYDFYLPSYKCIIEVHGQQHYREKTGDYKKGGRTLEEEQENDKFKEWLAKENGIDKYIVIDARKSDYELILKSILSSELANILDIPKEEMSQFGFNTNSSRIRDIWRMWDEGKYSVKEISAIIKMDRSNVSKYLKLGRDLKTCSY